MAVQPRQPPQRDGLGKLLTIGGAIVGGVATGGSPGGALAGAGAGQTAAGLVQQPQAAPVESQGMGRRRQAISQDPVRSIAEAQAALQGLPPEQFPEVRRAFQEAMAMAQRNQQLGQQGRV